MADEAVPIACDLGALSADEREQRALLAAKVTGRIAEVVERPDGYAARLPADEDLARQAFEWFLLEQRCCPFLRLEIELDPGSEATWVRLRGGPGVKEFLASAGALPSRARRSG